MGGCAKFICKYQAIILIKGTWASWGFGIFWGGVGPGTNPSWILGEGCTSTHKFK